MLVPAQNVHNQCIFAKGRVFLDSAKKYARCLWKILDIYNIDDDM